MQHDYTDTQFSELSFFSSLKGKLITFFLAVSLIPLIGVGWFTFIQARNELQDQAFDKLVVIRNLKAKQITDYFQDVNQSIKLLSGLEVVQLAMLELGNFAEVQSLDDIREAGLLGRPELDDTPGYTQYGLSHRSYHPFFSEVVHIEKYQDIYLVTLDGDIVYSQAKGDDFATNLVDGPYSNTELGRLFRELRSIDKAGEIRITDYALYPAGDAILSFWGTPIIDDTDTVPTGVLIYALPLNNINDLVQDKAGLEDDYIETYLVGQDKMVRSATGFYTQDIVDTSAIQKGLAGVTGYGQIKNDQGEEIFSAYQPIEVSGLKWILLAEESREDAIASANELGGWTLIVTAFTAVVVIWLGLVVALRIANPIGQLTNVAQRVTGGDLEAQAQVKNQDETGQLAQAFNTMTAQLRQSIGSLEEQVQERTAELAASVEIGQQATAIRNLDELLPNIATFIRDRFELHYVQVFLVDDTRQNLILRAGTGQVGQGLLADNFSLPINIDTAVGRSVVESRSIVVADTTVGYVDPSQPMSSSWYSALIRREQAKKPASLLPETLSELAMPLMVEGQVLGVLDLQDNKIWSFSEKDLSVYEAIALQLSFSIDSTKQWALTQAAQKRAEEAVKQLTREAWAERLASRKDSTGFVYDLSRIASLLPDAYSLTATPENGCSAPLVVQDQTIGYLSVRTPGDRDLTEDERVLLQAVAQQLAQKAENLRLFEATQQRASREQIARRIIDKIRASRNIEMALKTAAEELNKTLGTARAVVDLQVAPQPIPAEEQNVDSAEIKSAPDASSVNDSLDEVSLLRRYGHSGLL